MSNCNIVSTMKHLEVFQGSIDPLWVHEALRSPVLGMDVEIERNVDIAVNGIRGVVDSLTAPVTSADRSFIPKSRTFGI